MNEKEFIDGVRELGLLVEDVHIEAVGVTNSILIYSRIGECMKNIVASVSRTNFMEHDTYKNNFTDLPYHIKDKLMDLIIAYHRGKEED